MTLATKNGVSVLSDHGVADLLGKMDILVSNSSDILVNANPQKEKRDLVEDHQALMPTVFHVTHWKAGSQWINKILQQITQDRIVLPQLDEKQFLDQELISGAVYPTVYVTKEQFQSVVLPENYRKFIIIRDLRDTLISGYYSIRYSHAVIDESLARWRERLEVMTTARIQESWLKAGEVCIRYEDLLSQDSEILERVLIDHCELPVTSERLGEIVLANRFENLTGGRKPGEESLLAHERKGIAGDWLNHFTPKLSDEFNKRFGDLVVAGGYSMEDTV